MRLGKNYIQGNTSGYRGWRPLRQVVGQDDNGNPESVQVFRNILTGEIHRDWGKGWNGEPPRPTGDLSHLRHMGGTDELWESFRQKAIEDARREGKEPPMWTKRRE